MNLNLQSLRLVVLPMTLMMMRMLLLCQKNLSVHHLRGHGQLLAFRTIF